MNYGVIKNTIRVIHNSNDIKEVERNINLLNTNEESEIITEEEYKKRVDEENKNKVQMPTTEELLIKEIANLKIEIMQLKGGNA